MCKKEKYEKHRNVLVFFFAFAMLVILNSQKLSLRELSILDGFIKFLLVKLLYHISMNFSTDLAFLCLLRLKI